MLEALALCGYGADTQATTPNHERERIMISLIVSLVMAGIAGWLAGNIMKAQPSMSAAAPSSAT